MTNMIVIHDRLLHWAISDWLNRTMSNDMRAVYDKSPWRYEMPQDLMYGGVCHPVDLLRWFLGEAEEVFAYGSHGGLDSRCRFRSWGQCSSDRAMRKTWLGDSSCQPYSLKPQQERSSTWGRLMR